MAYSGIMNFLNQDLGETPCRSMILNNVEQSKKALCVHAFGNKGHNSVN